MLVPCFVMQCFVFFLVFRSSRWSRESAGCFTFILFLLCYVSVIVLCLYIMVPWVGLVCDCGISWLFSLFFDPSDRFFSIPHSHSWPRLLYSNPD